MEYYLILSTIMMFVGLYGFVTRRNLLAMLISVELILNSVDINFVVFNRSQVDGADDENEDVPAPMSERIADAKAFLEHAGVPVTFGLHDAYYRPDEDRIYMPARSAFESDEAMIATEGHELVHATGHVSRLARDTLRDYHKERAIRAREELVALSGQSAPLATLQ